MKKRGDIMSPWITPRLIGNSSVFTRVPSASWTVVNAEADAYMTLAIALILLEAPVFSKDWSRNLWLTESNAEV